MSPKQVEAWQCQGVDLARQVLGGGLGIIVGCRRLTTLGRTALENIWADSDFEVFARLESESDHLPLGDQRALWDETAFSEKQAEVARFEDSARAEVLAACRSLIKRFGGV